MGEYSAANRKTPVFTVGSLFAECPLIRYLRKNPSISYINSNGDYHVYHIPTIKNSYTNSP